MHEATLNEKLLWQPSQDMIKGSNVNKFMIWLEESRGLKFNEYNDLWEWSVNDLEGFWSNVWDYFEIKSYTDYEAVLSGRKMPNIEWFLGATLNYAEHVFRNEVSDKPAIISQTENRPKQELTWAELKRKTAAIAGYLKSAGVKRGDRVVAYAPNIPETVAAFLACASIGAVWSSCAPEFGIKSVIDRFKQIEPKVLFAVDGYQYGGKKYDRLESLRKIQKELPSLQETVIIPYLEEQPVIEDLKNWLLWDEIQENYQDIPLTFEPVPFHHPLWILYSSGTTGKPKGIVQSQGGILIEHLKALTLGMNLKKEDKFFWYTTTGWMMWNLQIGGLLTGTTILLYDGNPGYPDHETLWKFVEDTEITVFGTSASFIMASMKAGIKPSEQFDLRHLKAIGVTGSPLPDSGFDWVYDQVKQDVWLYSTSGGTDVCAGFVGGNPLMPVYRGEIQARSLGVAVQAYNDAGEAVIDEIGELVVTEPMPSMPIYFWNDETGERYKSSYFEVFPDIWRHGDFIKFTPRGSSVIFGRSDATINRGGIRMGTSEIYSALEVIPTVIDSLIVDIPLSSEESFMPLFVVLKEGFRLSEELKSEIYKTIRQNCSPRHVPNQIFEVKALPKTLNGKKIEVPIKKILMGVALEQAVNSDSLLNPETLQYFVEFRKNMAAKAQK
ncbi:acetoacetate--CoA ligase [Bacillus sp. FJAT-27251]|uniref:acetoacetate--CoA ligase n=1 Tax=Bacillus sp. FJAT-27251 TaxID=1684142 RepID=UPI0006A76E0C|nr:acetoacetate--CoA ligase [Bacillus sp. FJAT-27251]